MKEILRDVLNEFYYPRRVGRHTEIIESISKIARLIAPIS